MKILSIRLKNLASLANEHFIDFEADPLASAGLIAIVGKTGAGKSTILDAMCLALFNRIPRLKDSDGKLPDGENSEFVLANSPLTVLRRGSAHGFAELCFIAQDQKRYLARWELKRARDKADGKLQSVQRYLTCLTDDVVVADKSKAVDESIKRITQLSFEQFTRAVLLAQSEVTAFLKARDSERGELLEYLTDSAIFAKIGQLAFEKTKLMVNQRKEIENIIGHISLLSKEDLQQLHSDYEQAQQQYQQVDQQLINLKQHQQWFERQNQLNADIATREQHYNHALQQYQQLDQSKQQLDQLDRFAEIRPSVNQQQQAQTQQHNLTTKLQHAEQSFQQISAQFAQQQPLYQQHEQAQQQVLQFTQQHQAELQEIRKSVQKRTSFSEQYREQSQEIKQLQQQYTPLAEQLQQQQQYLSQLQQQQQQLHTQLSQHSFSEGFDKALETHLVVLKNFITQYQPLETQHGDLTQLQSNLAKLQQQQQTLAQQCGDIAQFEQHIQTLRNQREDKSRQLDQVELIGKGIKQWLVDFAQFAPLRQSISQLITQQTEINSQIQQAQQQHDDDKNAHLQLQKILQQQRLIHAENVEKLRDLLKPDEACMVCGSTDHPYKHAHQDLSENLIALQEQQENEALAKAQQSATVLQQLHEDQNKLSVQLAQLQQQESSLQQHTQRTVLDLTAQIKQAKIYVDLDQGSTEIYRMFEHEQQLIQTQQQQIETSLNTAIEQHTQYLSLNEQVQKLALIAQKVEQLHGQVQLIVEALPKAQQADWQAQPLSTSQIILQLLNDRLTQLNQHQQINQQIDQQQRMVQDLNLNQQHIADNLQKAEHKLQLITTQAQKNTQHAKHLILQISQENHPQPHEWLDHFDQQQQQTQLDYQQAKTNFEQIKQDFDTQNQQITLLKAQSEQLLQQAQTAEQQIELWLKNHPDFNVMMIEQLSQIGYDSIQQLRVSIQNTERSYHDAITALNTMREELQKHQAAIPPLSFEQLQQQLTEQHALLLDYKKQSEALNLQLEMHQQNQTKQQGFVDKIAEIKEEEQRWYKISNLIGDAKGKDFRDYAQQYNLDILLEYANQQLNMLSQRYTLKRLEHSLSLAIIDHDMDNEVRSVASLSGGESFLTALALSLAIANMASGSTKIESLFIDEGFGTLDAASLHLVMNALDQLQDQGRKVVLISHIAEMHERIPVQIQVQPLGSGSSQIKIVG